MKRAWIIGCLVVFTCGAGAALAWHVNSLATPLEREFASGGYVKIKLPEAQVVELEEMSELDVQVMLSTSVARTDVPPIADGSSPAAFVAEAGPEGSEPDDDQMAELSEASAPAGLVAINFDLADTRVRDRSALDVRKGVEFNGTDAGQATIRITADSTLFIASNDLRAVLGAAGGELADKLARDETFIGFDEVRATGLKLHYDAASDRIVISS